MVIASRRLIRVTETIAAPYLSRTKKTVIVDVVVVNIVIGLRGRKG